MKAFQMDQMTDTPSYRGTRMHLTRRVERRKFFAAPREGSECNLTVVKSVLAEAGL